MTSRDFVYWLQGFFELSGGPVQLTPQQMDLIWQHLSMVFIHEIDPSVPTVQQAALNAVHPPPVNADGSPVLNYPPGVRC